MIKEVKENSYLLKIAMLYAAPLVMSGCDCIQNVSGKIVDKTTGKPVVGITVAKNNTSDKFTTTDSTGYFKLKGISGGRGCPPMEVIIAGGGYKTTREEIPADDGYKVIQVEKTNH